MATALEIKQSLGKLTPEHRIARYLVKMARNMNNPQWKNDKAVQEVLTNDILDIKKVRAKFEAQDICTPQEFDTAIAKLRTQGLVKKDTLWREKLSPIEQATDLVDTDVYNEGEIEEMKKDADRILEFPKAERDEMLKNSRYSDALKTEIAKREAKPIIKRTL